MNNWTRACEGAAITEALMVAVPANAIDSPLPPMLRVENLSVHYGTRMARCALSIECRSPSRAGRCWDWWVS